MVNSFKQPIRTGVSYPRLFIHFSACLFASLTMIIGSIMRSNHLLTIINEKIDIGYFNWCSADECHVISEWCAENTTTLDAKMKYTFCSTEYKIAIALDYTSLIISTWIGFVFLACFSAWLLAYVRTWGKRDIHDDKDDVKSLNDPNLEPVKPPSWTRYFHFFYFIFVFNYFRFVKFFWIFAFFGHLPKSKEDLKKERRFLVDWPKWIQSFLVNTLILNASIQAACFITFYCLSYNRLAEEFPRAEICFHYGFPLGLFSLFLNCGIFITYGALRIFHWFEIPFFEEEFKC